jgi:hypothetical protein
MPGDPKECQANATHCSELVAKTTNQILKGQFVSLAARWTQLATELEHTRKLMEACGTPMSSDAYVPWYSQNRPQGIWWF